MKTITTVLAMLMLFAAVVFAGDSTMVQEKKADKATKGDDKAMTEKVEGDKATKEEAKEPEIITTESGLRYQNLVMGTGVAAERNMPVVCHYTIWLADSTGLVKGNKIQSSKDSGKEFHCTIGKGLIEGWNEGMIGMKEGGTRRIFVPSTLAWGSRGMGSMIPPNSNVIFELDFIKKDEPIKK